MASDKGMTSIGVNPAEGAKPFSIIDTFFTKMAFTGLPLWKICDEC